MSWDATNLESPHRHLLPREDHGSASDHIVNSEQMAVNIEAKEASMDGFINYIVTITIYCPLWVYRANNIALFVIHIIIRQMHPYETLKQDDPSHSSISR